MQASICPPQIRRLTVHWSDEDKVPVPESLQRNTGRADGRHEPYSNGKDSEEDVSDCFLYPAGISEYALVQQQYGDLGEC